MKRHRFPLRLGPLLVSAVVVVGLYWGLNQAESRLIYAPWDKLLHGSVFFVIWWLTRWSLRFGWLWVTCLVIAGGGAEEVHQLWEGDHVADWYDWYADIAGACLALAIYTLGRCLLLLRASVAEPAASLQLPVDARSPGIHAVDGRWALRLWRWDLYVVVLAGHNRRALSRREQAVARWGVAILVLLFVLVSTATGLLVLFLIELALGLNLVPDALPGLVRSVVLR